MSLSEDALAGELRALRKGRGVQSPTIADAVGPQLSVACGIAVGDSPADIREKLAGRLGALAKKLPQDLRAVVVAALALTPDAQGPFLQDRVQRLADQENRDVRTIRRRVDEAINMLAQQAVRAGATPARTDGDGWRVVRLESLLRMDVESPVCFERRFIKAESSGVEEVRELMTLPRGAETDSAEHDVGVEVQYGVELVRQERVRDTRFAFVLRLPHALSAGDSHDYGLVLRVPPGQPMRTHYVFFPRRSCDSFALRVRFPAGAVPRNIWKVAEVFHRDLDDEQLTREELVADRVGEVSVDFDGLIAGHGYGVQWSDS
jgi:hypothetical protein